MDGRENFRAQKYLNSKMKISVLCFALFLSRVLSDRPMKLQVAGHHQCVVNVAESSRKLFNESLESGKKVIFFRIHYDSKQAEALTRPIPDNHFANPNDYMWLYDGDNGLPVYMNAPYDFELLSLFILKEYTSILIVNMNVSTSCNENILSRVDFLRLVFHQLIHIVSPVRLPDKKATDYVCYDVNNRKNLPDYSFWAYQHLGISRVVLHKYCCKVKDIDSNYNGTDLCPGGQMGPKKILDIQDWIVAFLFAFFPLFLSGFISGAKLKKYHSRFDHIRSVSKSFSKGEQFDLHFGTEDCWINEHDDRYSIYTLVKWLFLFYGNSFLASRIRRSLAVFLFMSTILFDFVFQCLFYKDELKIYLEDNIPIGYRAMIFGYKKSAENTDYFLGGPYVWFSAYAILGLIVINIPSRLCQTIADSTLKQRKTRTFLIQDVKLLELYGSLDLWVDRSQLPWDDGSLNLRDDDHVLLYAIMKSSLFTAINPAFWCAVVEQWFGRCISVYNYFNNLGGICQLVRVCVTLSCAFISFFLCACELLLCVVYYGCPQLVIWKSILHSYTMKYICPYTRGNNLGRKILRLMLFPMSLPVYLFLFLFSTYLFLTTFQLLSSYVMFTVIALIAKPDAVGYVIITSVFFYFFYLIIKSNSESYESLLKISIKLADSVCKDFVYKRLGERFIYRELFDKILDRYYPFRYEVAKALTKLALACLFFTSCLYAFENISLNISSYFKMVVVILTTMIPKLTTVLKETSLDSRWEIERISETIRFYKLGFDFRREVEMEMEIEMENRDELCISQD